jgi:hypothetical protein
LQSPDVVVELIKSGDHRLSDADGIARMCALLDELVAKAAT